MRCHLKYRNVEPRISVFSVKKIVVERSNVLNMASEVMPSYSCAHFALESSFCRILGKGVAPPSCDCDAANPGSWYTQAKCHPEFLFFLDDVSQSLQISGENVRVVLSITG